jgi:holo-[acyl-carrier protein] synthase
MIKGVGTDIVDVDRIAENIEKYGERFAQRILAKSELAEYEKTKMKAQFLASRFAVKEAVAKALGTGFRDGLAMHDIATSKNELGKPSVVYYAKAKELVLEQGITDTHVSIAHERHTTIAFVVLV